MFELIYKKLCKLGLLQEKHLDIDHLIIDNGKIVTFCNTVEKINILIVYQKLESNIWSENEYKNIHCMN